MDAYYLDHYFGHTAIPEQKHSVHDTLRSDGCLSGQLPDRAGIQASIHDRSPRDATFWPSIVGFRQ
jgi:hypothetical protein